MGFKHNLAGILSAALLGLAAAPDEAGAVSYASYKARQVVLKVRPGNQQLTSPAIDPNSNTAKRRKRTQYNNKIKAIFGFFRREKELVGKIKTIARIYNIAPVHILGAIAGEHAFNVNVFDDVQKYAMKSIVFGGNRFVSFACRKCGLKLSEFLELGPLKKCNPKKGSQQFWSCAENIWISTYYDKKVGKIKYPRLRFNEAFFNPYSLGQTYGLGQLSPLTALKATDLTSKLGGLKKLDISRPAEVYSHILDTDKNLHYIAATIRLAIESYRRIANFDISANPGLAATLYNLGHVRNKALRLYERNLKLLKSGKKLHYPQVNYYGWFVNARQKDLEKLLQ